MVIKINGQTVGSNANLAGGFIELAIEDEDGSGLLGFLNAIPADVWVVNVRATRCTNMDAVLNRLYELRNLPRIIEINNCTFSGPRNPNFTRYAGQVTLWSDSQPDQSIAFFPLVTDQINCYFGTNVYTNAYALLQGFQCGSLVVEGYGIDLNMVFVSRSARLGLISGDFAFTDVPGSIHSTVQTVSIAIVNHTARTYTSLLSFLAALSRVANVLGIRVYWPASMFPTENWWRSYRRFVMQLPPQVLFELRSERSNEIIARRAQDHRDAALATLALFGSKTKSGPVGRFLSQTGDKLIWAKVLEMLIGTEFIPEDYERTMRSRYFGSHVIRNADLPPNPPNLEPRGYTTKHRE